MKSVVRLWWVLPCICLLSGCEKKPTDGLVSANSNAVAPTGTPMVIYDDSLETGGTVGLIPSGDNQQISLSYTNNPHSGRYCISYSWNGNPVSNPPPSLSPNPEQTFAGFQLIVATGAPPRNLSAAGYTTCTFWLRGNLSSNVSVQVQGPSNGNSNTIAPTYTPANVSNSWTQYAFSISPGNLQSVAVFFGLTLIYAQPTGTTNPGQGGTVYVDDIQFSK
jgi:hypothetical protein